LFCALVETAAELLADALPEPLAGGSAAEGATPGCISTYLVRAATHSPQRRCRGRPVHHQLALVVGRDHIVGYAAATRSRARFEGAAE